MNPIIMGAAASGLGTVLGSILGGKSGDQTTITTTKTEAWKKTIHAPFENYQRTDIYSPQYTIAPTYALQFESPHATQTVKKEMPISQDVMANPQIIPTDINRPDTAQKTGVSAMAGADMEKIALIGAIALIGYGVLKK